MYGHLNVKLIHTLRIKVMCYDKYILELKL